MREPLHSADADEVQGGRDPLAEAIRSADLAALWRAIRELPRSQRDALLLRELGGLRYDELAVALAVTEPAVESLLVRARSRLRTELRTIYASFAPALRFLVGSGTPAIAAKAAALGLGAAAVTGGVAVAPTMLTRHHMQPPRARSTTRTTTTRTAPTTTRVAVVRPPVTPVLVSVAPTVTEHRRSGRHERTREHDAHDVTTGEREAEAPTVTGDGGTLSVSPGRSVGGSGSDRRSSGSDGGPGSDDGSGSGERDGGGGGDDGGDGGDG